MNVHPTYRPQNLLLPQGNLSAAASYTFSAKERDPETGLSYFGARYYTSDLSIWLSVDPMAAKYPSLSPYVYCADNPVKLVDPNGETWVDADGNEITDHSKIKVYIFYDPKSFDKQSRKMYKAAEKKYGVGSVALSDATTENEFAKDWGDMAGSNIQEVDLNYHGNNQTLMLNSAANQYITATGNGETNISGTKAKNVGDLPTPKGNISNAQLNINSCKSNSKTQYELKGSGLTLMQAFASAFKFKSVRGTSAGVSYNRFSGQPEPQHYYEHWEYIPPRQIKGNSSYNVPLYYRTGGVR